MDVDRSAGKECQKVELATQDVSDEFEGEIIVEIDPLDVKQEDNYVSSLNSRKMENPYHGGQRKHKKLKKEEFKYPCDKCEYEAKTISHLKKHKESKHEGIRYPCDMCEYTATRPSYLKEHKFRKHRN